MANYDKTVKDIINTVPSDAKALSIEMRTLKLVETIISVAEIYKSNNVNAYIHYIAREMNVENLDLLKFVRDNFHIFTLGVGLKSGKIYIKNISKKIDFLIKSVYINHNKTTRVIAYSLVEGTKVLFGKTSIKTQKTVYEALEYLEFVELLTAGSYTVDISSTDKEN